EGLLLLLALFLEFDEAALFRDLLHQLRVLFIAAS
ncbi:hypothetical protein LOS08_23465, partial [Proteus mirabilis]